MNKEEHKLKQGQEQKAEGQHRRMRGRILRNRNKNAQ